MKNLKLALSQGCVMIYFKFAFYIKVRDMKNLSLAPYIRVTDMKYLKLALLLRVVT